MSVPDHPSLPPMTPPCLRVQLLATAPPCGDAAADSSTHLSHFLPPPPPSFTVDLETAEGAEPELAPVSSEVPEKKKKTALMGN